MIDNERKRKKESLKAARILREVLREKPCRTLARQAVNLVFAGDHFNETSEGGRRAK